jgi:hypothetical protein
MQVLYFISNHLPEWIGQCGIADYGPWTTKSHAVRVFSVGQKYHDFSKKLRKSDHQGAMKAEFFKMDGEKN